MARRTLRNDVKEWLEMTVWGYINGIIDDNYEPMTREGWLDYIMQTLDIDASSNQMVNGLEFKHIYFYGKEKIAKIADEYLNDEDVKEYVVR